MWFFERGMLDTGCWFLDARCWMLDAGCWMLDVGLKTDKPGNEDGKQGQHYHQTQPNS